MVRFEMVGTNGRQIIGLGLSDENIKRLKDKQPIYFSLEEFGFEESSVVIMWGKTEGEIAAELTEFVRQQNGTVTEGLEYCDCPPGGPMRKYPHPHNPRPQA